MFKTPRNNFLGGGSQSGFQCSSLGKAGLLIQAQLMVSRVGLLACQARSVVLKSARASLSMPLAPAGLLEFSLVIFHSFAVSSSCCVIGSLESVQLTAP